MAKVLVTESYLADIANAIRSKTGSSDVYTPEEMASAISSISAGYPEPTGTVSITQNGTANVKDYASANVNVPNSYSAGDEGKVVSSGALVAQTARSSQITVNGTYDTTLENEIVVNVSGSGGDNIDSFIASSGTASVDTGVAGNTVYGIYLEFEPITVISDYQWYAGGASNNFTIASMTASAGVTSGFIRCFNHDYGVVTFVKGKNILEVSNGVLKLNSTALDQSFTGPINTTNVTIKLFGNGTSSLSHSKIYKCVLYDVNGDVIKELVPAINNNGIPCFHDEIGDSYLYGNNNKLVYGGNIA